MTPNALKHILAILLLMLFFSSARADDATSKPEQVGLLLKQSQILYDSGHYDQAVRCCEHALEIDLYSVAARKQEEKIVRAKTALIKKSRETRSKESDELIFPIYQP